MSEKFETRYLVFAAFGNDADLVERFSRKDDAVASMNNKARSYCAAALGGVLGAWVVDVETGEITRPARSVLA